MLRMEYEGYGNGRVVIIYPSEDRIDEFFIPLGSEDRILSPRQEPMNSTLVAKAQDQENLLYATP